MEARKSGARVGGTRGVGTNQPFIKGMGYRCPGSANPLVSLGMCVDGCWQHSAAQHNPPSLPEANLAAPYPRLAWLSLI